MPLFAIRGVKEIQRAYKVLGKRAPKVIRPALRKAVRPMQARAKQLAPKHTGTTARSIKVRARKRSRRTAIGIDVRIGEGDYKGTTFYSAFPNFGTSRQPGQHFMERAFAQTQDECRTIAANEIAAGTIREWKNL